MPLEVLEHWDQEPDDDALIWRYLTMYKFRDLMANEESYFRRPDGFDDKAEGIPSEKMVAQLGGWDRFVITERPQIDNIRGSFSQFRESYFISSWTLHSEENLRMWYEYVVDKHQDVKPRDLHGLAICSRYGALKAVLNALIDTTYVGAVWYDKYNLKRPGNVICQICSKEKEYKWEREIRAMLYFPAIHSGGNLHIDGEGRPHPDVLQENQQYRYHWHQDHKRRRIDLKALIEGIVMSPWASPDVLKEVKDDWVRIKGHSYPVTDSSLKSPLMPSFSEYFEKRHLW